MSRVPREVVLSYLLVDPSVVLAAPADISISMSHANISPPPATLPTIINPALPIPMINPNVLTPTDSALLFDPADKLWLEAVRLVSPFGDSILTSEPNFEFWAENKLTAGPPAGEPSITAYYHNPIGEWLSVNRFFNVNLGSPLGNPSAINVRMRLLSDLTVYTKGVDTIWNGTSLQLSCELKIRYHYPRIG